MAADWTVVVLTCQHRDSAFAFQRELEIRRDRGSLGRETILLTVEDPKAQVGSGGATLNALLVAAEHLSAQAGHTVVTADVLQEARILILHMGRDFLFDDCSRAFLCLPLEDPAAPTEVLACHLDQLLATLTERVCRGSPPGVWVSSTDMFLTVPAMPEIDWRNFQGVKVVAVPASISYARQYGVYSVDSQGLVQDILYQSSEEEIQRCLGPDGKVPLSTATEENGTFLNLPWAALYQRTGIRALEGQLQGRNSSGCLSWRQLQEGGCTGPCKARLA
ncbi:hypothetical protein E2320_000957 [Naja naja]|nr:hypothetical protein E2320_000957 [Naja naja]